MPILEICEFSDWLIEKLPKTGCKEIVVIQPDHTSNKKTDRRDANAPTAFGAFFPPLRSMPRFDNPSTSDNSSSPNERKPSTRIVDCYENTIPGPLSFSSRIESPTRRPPLDAGRPLPECHARGRSSSACPGASCPQTIFRLSLCKYSFSQPFANEDSFRTTFG